MQILSIKALLLFPGALLLAWLLFRAAMARYWAIGAPRPGYELLAGIFVYYCGVVISITVLPAHYSGFNNPRYPGLNMVPVARTYREFIATLGQQDKTDRNLALDNIIGNLLLLLPLGAFLPILFTRFRRAGATVAACLLVSVSIEALQFQLRYFGTYRTVDIDDVLLNTIGGWLGWFLFNFLIAPRISSFSTKKKAPDV